MKKKLMRFNLAALALVMVTSVLISGTFAKYTTAVSAQDTALIAKWDISSVGTGMVGNTEDLDLFKHAYSVGIENSADGNYILGPGVEDSFVVNLSGVADVDATIDLKINKTGVDAPIQYAVTKKDVDVNWEADTIYYSKDLLAQAILDTMAASSDTDKVVTNNKGSRVGAEAQTPGEKAIVLEKNTGEPTNVDVVVHWRWPFNADAVDEMKNDHDQEKLVAAGFDLGTDGKWTDEDDTKLGVESARQSYSLELILTAEQITPEVPTP